MPKNWVTDHANEGCNAPTIVRTFHSGLGPASMLSFNTLHVIYSTVSLPQREEGN
jgi:hypothetical protein